MLIAGETLTAFEQRLNMPDAAEVILHQAGLAGAATNLGVMPRGREHSLSRKKQVLERLFQECQQKGSWEFTNADVQRVAKQVGFRNPFDATKVDTREVLPSTAMSAGYCLAHVGQGKHVFIPELRYWFHDFEPITTKEIVSWRYRKSLLNDLDRGEASTLSFVLNQRILHDFIYEDVVASPKVYIPGRTRATLEYTVGQTRLQAVNQQLEMDLVLEYQGTVTVLEAKSKFLSNFAVYQIYHPIKYYLQQSQAKGIPIAHLNACYVLKQTRSGTTRVRMYLYEFDDPDRLDSIRLVRKAEYHLQQR
ncbi:MAG: hypothetical protein NZ843_06970 [Fimbriimonadales bacterium]|nr:hypothetical protein [Fimbriimonadales bacterium]